MANLTVCTNDLVAAYCLLLVVRRRSPSGIQVQDERTNKEQWSTPMWPVGGLCVVLTF